MGGSERVHRLEALRASRLFRALPAVDLDAVLAAAAERRFPRGAVIFQKGDAGSSMMAVLAGRVRIGAVSPDGRQLTLDVVGAGGVFGEMALLDGKARSADVTAVEDTTLLEIGRAAFLRLLGANGELLSRTLALLCDRVRSASAAAEDLALSDLPTRLARVLVRLAGDHGRATPGGVRVELRLSQQDLSTLVGASRESVNRQLQAWRDGGILAVEDGRHLIRRLERLEAFAR